MKLFGEDKKYVWWGLLGIGVAAFFYFLSSTKQQGQQVNTVTVPYLVPQASTGASPTANTSLSNQSNIIGNSPNSNIPNGTNPLGGPNIEEVPGQYGWLPQLNSAVPTGVQNNVTSGMWFGSQPMIPNAVPQAQSPTHA